MRPWLRPVPFAVAAALITVSGSRAAVDDAAANASTALCGAVADRGISCFAEDVVWVDGARSVLAAEFGSARALIRGRERSDEARNVFLARARLSPEGRVLDVLDVHPVTRSTDADVGAIALHGTVAAYVVSIDGRPETIHVVDVGGHSPQAYDDLSRVQRWQVKIADWQATGEWRGIKRTVFALVPPPRSAEVAFRPDGMVDVHIDSKSFVLDPSNGTTTPNTSSLRAIPEVITKPPTFAAWTSDRLRAIPWFGDENNQALKALVFTGLEWIKGARSKLTGDQGASEAADDMASVGGGKLASTFVDPEIGWPPRPLDPVMKPALPGEGMWVSLGDDPFITPIPGVAAPFVTTFVRTDPTAEQTRVYVTMWDPRLVSLHMEAGTVEPVSASGSAGTGIVPRAPEVMGHLVAGFNGGFQATHGEFGMQADGTMYLPPKPYAATVLDLKDGTTAFGAWPRTADVPDEVRSFRQNMTALVQNDKYNPWGRAWWGGVPPGWHDAVHTTRSGICLTKENFVGYFYGNDIGPEPLGRAMLAARCAFGIHLDMNPGLAGFEFYNVQREGAFRPLARPLQADWETEGTLRDLPGFKFRSRRMIKSMGHMLFPRYIHRDARDFFYLTSRDVLPGAPLPAQDSPSFRVKGLPQHGYPYAIAIAYAPAKEKHLRVLRIDPKTVRVGGEADSNAMVVAFGRGAKAADKRVGHDAGADAGATAPEASTRKKLWLIDDAFSISVNAPESATLIANVIDPSNAGRTPPRAAVGISSTDGMLQWVELAPEDQADEETSREMLALLDRIGCASRALVVGSVRAFLGGTLDISAQPETPSSITVGLVRRASPAARPYFESTAIVGPGVWQPLQQQRVKWRPTLAPPEKPSASGSASSSPPPTPRPTK